MSNPVISYAGWVAVLLLARGADFLSTWVATPDLAMESNPIARRLGWKWGAVFNLAQCFVLGLVPESAVVVCTASVLAAASNFRTAAMLLNVYDSTTHGSFPLTPALSPGERERHAALWCQGAYAAGIGLVGFGFCVKPEWHLGMGIGVVAFAVASILFSIKWRNKEESYGI